MTEGRRLLACVACCALLACGCSSPSDTEEQEAVTAPAPAESPATIPDAAAAPDASAPPAKAPAEQAASPAPAEPAAPAPAPTVPAPSTAPPKPLTAPAPAPAAAPAPVPAPAVAPVAPPSSPPSAAAVVDPGGQIEVAATKPGLTRVGSDACEMCHAVQFESWAGSAHASRQPPLDCEGCHGPGSAYKTMAVMKDAAKARTAGLVIPDQSFCSRCHRKAVNAALLKAAHAHEE